MARCKREYPAAAPLSRTHAAACFLAEEALKI
jgi:hypothetical protein